uniref:Phosphatidylserine synthase n=1 Tax=Timema tahoe TaxID=61484 RepID=A0A7R9NVA6_9NEOP|nr:unnamed protein product [Timema tahoe]
MAQRPGQNSTLLNGDSMVGKGALACTFPLVEGVAKVELSLNAGAHDRTKYSKECLTIGMIMNDGSPPTTVQLPNPHSPENGQSDPPRIDVCAFRRIALVHMGLHFYNMKQSDLKTPTIKFLRFSMIFDSFFRDEADVQDNIWAGMCCVVFFFLIISVLAFPNGPFTRPHPAIWRMVFGMSVLYLMGLLFLLFQSFKTVNAILYWIDPSLKDFNIDMDKEYGVNCSDVSLERIWSHVDVFAAGHFLGWMFKAILVRHFGILWAISVMWEFTEVSAKCGGDATAQRSVSTCEGIEQCTRTVRVIVTIIIVQDIHSTSGKLKRAVLQFTPGSWTHVRWLDPTCTYMRFFALCQLVIFWQVSELNTFFLKHIFEMPPSHPIVALRLILIGVIVAPSVRQYYSYTTDTQCKRVGTQCWVYGAIMVTEAILCIKNGKELFERTQAVNIIIWFLLQLMLSIMCVYGFVLWHKYIQGPYLAIKKLLRI